MSGKLQIHFDPDMPAAAVEVVAPNLESVGRVWLEPGGSAGIDVPSEESFLRIHLPSGQVVTLQDPGNLNRQVHLQDLMPRSEKRKPSFSAPASIRKRLADLRTLHQYRPLSRGASDVGLSMSTSPPFIDLVDGSKVELRWPDALPMVGRVAANGQEIHFSAVNSDHPCDLKVTTAAEQLDVRLPGKLQEVYVRTDEIGDGFRILSVRVETSNRIADSLGAYMTRGDFYSASSLTSWADQAEQMLFEKIADPFAATVASYLLLRMRQFDLMRTWARNLADGWPNLTDGSVIWAWQQIYQHGSENEIRKYFERAAAGPLPVFTEGLKLLGDGLRLLGPNAKPLIEDLNKKAGVVLWESPFTASLKAETVQVGKKGRVKFDVGYISEA